ncbi:MAG TPA: Gfo/Idh/MocA family oxidoreductase, partial [Chitinophagaceae bacterium]|nr:Gfo/Idh/MocA family oxidoreductase [Chitinophagaceae bacterium]
MEKIIRTGLIGFGISGQVFHAPFLTTVAGYRLDTIVQRHDQTASRSYPGISIRKSVEDVLNDPDIDLVVITVPTSGHYDLALNALQAKKHVVLEKPFTVTSEDALELIRVAREMGVLISPYHNRRYTGDFKTIRSIMEQGGLGRIVEFEGHYDRFRPQLRPGAWREQALPGSGILYDLGSHLIDQALLLFGSPKQITASLRIQRPGAGATDYFDLRLDYADLA